MRSPRTILAEAKRQGATLELLPGDRLALKGGDTQLRQAIDRHLAALLVALQPLVEPIQLERETRQDRPRISPAPRRPRSCLNCAHHRPPRCAALGIEITRNRAHRCGTFEPATGTRSKA